ncbi:MAG: cytochrome c oxidase subunit II [Flavobacteriales bacterium]|jgi:cytochrome c oxidase subunit 2|tara:strand:- start:5 stop:1294 length:1290 start_codon:yes stop_codon:yes gene_type:complete
MKFLIIIVIVLVIITAAQLMKVYEHSSRLRNKDEADVTEGETKFNAGMLLVFYLALMISSTYLFIVYGARPGLGPSASEHGVEIDYLYDVNWIILIIVYYLTQTLLFVFAIKYHQKKGRKAVFFSHSTKLELLWTVIPAVTLAGIIIAGLMVWNKITAMPENAQVIEIYAKQFDWTVRYSGEDNTLGNSNFKVIETNNPLGVVTSDLIDAKELAWKADIAKLEKTISEEGDLIPDAKLSEMKFKLERLNRQLIRLTPLRKVQTPQTDSAANDDVIVKELYLVKGEVYEFKFRSRDVIHSALFPHFRAQMNCVPGMTTRLSFKPTISTAEMRENPEVIAQYKKTNEKRAAEGREEVDFNYLLLCNKICGASHYNMQMNIVVVDTQAEFDIWYAKQKESKTFAQLAGLLEPEEITDSTIKEVIVIQEVAAD